MLRRLRILVFDFTAEGSAAEELAREGAARVLDASDAAKATQLWDSLVSIAIDVAASGGSRDRAELVAELASKGFRLAGDRRLGNVRAAIAEASSMALADIDDRIGSARLTRAEHVSAVHETMERGRYVEIRGDAGVGKSGVLKHFATLLGGEGQIIVLSPGRTPAGGWSALRGQLGFDGAARELLTDIASGGGAALFLDNLKLVDPDEQRTVVDLVRAAADVAGFSVVATARLEFAFEEGSWLPADAIEKLGQATPVVIGELSAVDITS